MGKLRVVMGTDAELREAVRPMGELIEMGARGRDGSRANGREWERERGHGSCKEGE